LTAQDLGIPQLVQAFDIIVVSQRFVLAHPFLLVPQASSEIGYAEVSLDQKYP